MPIFLVARRRRRAGDEMNGPVILIANLLTEGRGMLGFTAADAVARIEEASGRKVDVVITNTKLPSPQVLGRYALEHKEPLAIGELPEHCELVGGEFWTGEIARHDRMRLAYAIWSVLSRRLLTDELEMRRFGVARPFRLPCSAPFRVVRDAGQRLALPAASSGGHYRLSSSATV